MKLFGKMTLMTMAVAVTSSFGFLSPMLAGGAGAAYGAAGEYAPVIRLIDYTPTYNVDDVKTFTYNDGTNNVEGQGYLLPTATVDGATSDYTVVAKDSSRKKATVRQSTEGMYFLVATKADTYEIIYSAESSDGTTKKVTSTQNIKVTITNSGATLVMPENVAQIIPETAKVGDKIVLPRAQVFVDEEEDADKSNEVKVQVLDALGNEKAAFSQSAATAMEYTIAEGAAGDFIVKYTYTEGGVVIAKSQTFRVVSTTQDVSLKYADSLTSKLESMALEVGVEATLPKPTVVNSEAGDADVSKKVYTEITVKLPDGTEKKVTDFKFTPKQVGSYRFSYKTVDFYGNSCEVSVARDNIKLSSNSINVKVVNDYETADLATTDFDELATVEHGIASELYIVGSASGVVGEFPAMLAKGGWNGYDNLQMIRTIWKNGNKIGTLEDDHSVQGTKVKFDANKTGKFEFTEEGTYEIYYQAKYLNDQEEEISSTQKSIYYTFEVKKVSSLPTEEDANLTIQVPKVSTSAVLKNEGEKITFSAPSASDKYDTRLNIEVVYKIAGLDTEFKATKESDGSYSIKVERPEGCTEDIWNAATNLTIIFRATDDLGNKTEDTENSVVISLLDYSTDNKAPLWVETAGKATYDNSTKMITLPDISFADDSNADRTNVSLRMYVMKDGKVLDTFNGVTNTADGNFSAMLKTFPYEPTQEGTYEFVYVATDQNRNSATYTLSCDVDFQLGYSVAIDTISSQEYGTVLDLPSMVTVTKNGKVVNFENSNIKVLPAVTEADVTDMAPNTLLILVDGACEIDQSGVNGRVICKEGDIFVKAWAKDDKGVCDYVNNASTSVKFSSSDTTKPTFTIENESEGSSVIFSREYDETSAENTHTLPWFDTISDNGNINEESMKVELTYANSTTPFKTFTLEDANTEGGLDFEVTQEGKIKVVYSVSDAVKGNTATREFWIYIGDVLAPEIILDNDAITSPGKVGGSFSINLDKISFANDSDLSKTEDLKVVVKCNGNVVETEFDEDEKNIIFTASEAGSYVITFNITDEAGNEATTVTKTLTIKSNSPDSVNTTTIWGTVMIIISLIVVGVVIFFFVKPTRTGSKSKDKKTK